MPGSNVLAASSAAPKVLFSGQLTNTSDRLLYTPPANSSAIIKHAVICNTSSSAVTITKISVIPSGGSTDGTHHVISNYLLGANDSLPLAEYLDSCCLGPGDSIHAQVATANVIDIVITGVENT